VIYEPAITGALPANSEMLVNATPPSSSLSDSRSIS